VISVDLKGKIEIASKTHKGQVREHNEDSISENETLGIALLADGMGGLNAGEVASSMAVQLLMEELTAYCLGESALPAEIENRELENNQLEINKARHGDADGNTLPMAVQVVRRAVELANEAVFHSSQTISRHRGMGTTVVVALFYDDRVALAHLGDSRVYRFQDNLLERLTRDHSLVQELIDKGLYTKEEARLSEKRNVVTRALGVAPVVNVECSEHNVEVGDIFLQCSDGLHDLVSDEDIELAFRELSGDLSELSDYLVELANANGGKDNISVILTRIVRSFPANESAGLIRRIMNWYE